MKPTSESNFAVMIISSALSELCSGVPQAGKMLAYAVFKSLIQIIEKIFCFAGSCFFTHIFIVLQHQGPLQLLEVCCYILLIL